MEDKNLINYYFAQRITYYEKCIKHAIENKFFDDVKRLELLKSENELIFTGIKNIQLWMQEN